MKQDKQLDSVSTEPASPRLNVRKDDGNPLPQRMIRGLSGSRSVPRICKLRVYSACSFSMNRCIPSQNNGRALRVTDPVSEHCRNLPWPLDIPFRGIPMFQVNVFSLTTWCHGSAIKRPVECRTSWYRKLHLKPEHYYELNPPPPPPHW